MNKIWKTEIPTDDKSQDKLYSSELYIYDGEKVCLGRFNPIHGHNSRMESLDGTQLDWQAWCYREELESELNKLMTDPHSGSSLTNTIELNSENKVIGLFHVVIELVDNKKSQTTRYAKICNISCDSNSIYDSIKLGFKRTFSDLENIPDYKLFVSSIQRIM